jgi:hypothetical protein
MKQYCKRKALLLHRVLLLINQLKFMKRYSIVFSAMIFAGAFDEIDAAANSFAAGSGSSFTETESEAGKHLVFMDAYEQNQKANVGDALVAVTDDAGVFKGYKLVEAAEVATWAEVEAIAEPAAATV